MGRAQRFGIRLGRGWTTLLLLAAVLVGAAYWVGPLRSFPAEFELAVIDDGTLTQQATLPGVRTPQGAVQFALPLAMRNTGARPGAPARVALSVPAQYRVFTRSGMLPMEVSQGVPLRRYVVDVRTRAVPPDSAPFRLPGLDTIWLEADLPRYYCTLQANDVPEFVPAPRFDAATLGNVRIFYSVRDAASETRTTGVLAVQLPPELLQSTPAPMPPTFRTFIEEPEAQVPEFGSLVNAGTRRALCGDPQSAIELYTALWETRTGGRIHVVHVYGAERKRIYDLNADGVAELETWDGDGDGRFEARSEARYEIPAFLSPLPPRDPSMLEPDPVPPDSAFLAVFRNTAAGPSRFAALARQDSMRAARDSLMHRTLTIDTAAVAPPEPEWLALFNNTAAGPFRFTRRARPAPDSAAAGARADSVAADTVRRAPAPAPDPEPEPEPPPRRRPQPIGTPVPPPR